MPKVSVIIPVYNADLYLRECLDSVINQTLKDIEIICVDDGSTDNSLSILREYQDKDDRIKILSQNNQYAGVARNNGLDIALGNYVFFMDADDFCNKDLLLHTTKLADETGADIVVFDHYRYDEQNKSRELKHDIFITSLQDNYTWFNYSNFPYRIMSLINPVPWNKLIKREFLKKWDISFEPLSSTNDITFAALCSVCASKIVYLQEALITYRVNLEKSITSTKNKNLNNVIAALLALYYKSKKLPHYEEIEVSVQIFIAKNLIFALNNYAGQEGSEKYEDFLNEMSKMFFGLPLFYSLSQDKIKDKTLYEFIEKTKLIAASKFDISYCPEIIVSLTTYPARINTVHLVIDTIMKQTVKPNKIVLWLADSQFPNKENDLPIELTSLISNQFVVKWTKDIKSYKKLIPALKEYPDSLIITIDDDLLFDEFLVEKLLKGYMKKPKCIQCHRVTTIDYYSIGNIKVTPDALKVHPRPTYLHKLSGGAGCLYPPYSLHEDVMREELFMRLAPTSDDIWFWLMGVLNGYKVNVVDGNNPKLKYIPGTQETALYKINDQGEKLFFIHLRNILRYYPILQDILLCEQYALNLQEEKVSEQYKAEKIFYEKKLSNYENALVSLRSSWSFRIGRFLTWIPRKLRGCIRCYQEHGMKYTINRIMIHLHITNDNEVKKDNEDTAIFDFQQILTKVIESYKVNGSKKALYTILAYLHLIEEKQEKQEKQEDTLSKADMEGLNKLIDIKGENNKENIKREYEYYRQLPIEEYEEALKEWFLRTTKEELDLDNPKTYNEKIQWMKLYDSTPIKTKLADKYLVREWVKEKIGADYLIPLLGVWNDFDEIDFDSLPNSFVLKANHGCGWNIIVKDKATFDIAEAREKFTKWMNMNFAYKFGLELHYKNIPPKIIAEEYLENNNNDLYDYKVFCFNGKAENIMYLSNRKNGLRMAFYDLEWNKQNFTYSFPRNEEEIPKPQNLNLLIELAEKLSEGFPHVRVDFYILNDGSLKFGEMTFSSASGTCAWDPPEQNLIYGELIQLPEKRHYFGLEQTQET